MDDKKLLELAAKAAGIEIDKSPCNGGGRDNDGFDIMGNAVLDWHNSTTWNPLANDDDALRLAVKLGIRCGYERNAPPELGLPQECGVAAVNGKWFADTNADQNAAVRRAIVRAAAEMGITTDREACTLECGAYGNYCKCNAEKA